MWSRFITQIVRNCKIEKVGCIDHKIIWDPMWEIRTRARSISKKICNNAKNGEADIRSSNKIEIE